MPEHNPNETEHTCSVLPGCSRACCLGLLLYAVWHTQPGIVIHNHAHLWTATNVDRLCVCLPQPHALSLLPPFASGSISSLTEGHEMVSLGAVSTVVGSVGGGTATTHMAEQRRSTLRERVSVLAGSNTGRGMHSSTCKGGLHLLMKRDSITRCLRLFLSPQASHLCCHLCILSPVCLPAHLHTGPLPGCP